MFQSTKSFKSFVNPQAPVAQKNCGWGGFSTFPRWRSRVFFKSDLTDSPQIFDAHLFENTDLSPSRFNFSVGFISRSCFESDDFIAYSNEWDWREKERCLFALTNLNSHHLILKRYLFCRISDESALIRCNGRVRG